MKESKANESGLLRTMGEKISEIHRLAEELKELGEGMPVVEKNARCILGFTHALKFGISDVVEIMDNKGESPWGT